MIRSLFPSICALGGLLVLNWYAEQHHLYYFYWWLDMPVHFLAGFSVAQLTLLTLSQQFDTKIKSISIGLVAVLPAVLVGVSWECYEYLFNHHIYFSTHFVLDTTLDLLMDALGGYLGGLLFIKARYNNTHE